MPAVVHMYTTPFCGYCFLAKRVLAKKGVAFEEIDVSARPDMRAWLARTTGQRTVPQIFINEHPIGGWTELTALDRKGDLDALLSEPPLAQAASLPR